MTTDSPAAPDHSAAQSQLANTEIRASADAVRRLADAIARIGGDGEYLIETLTDMLLAVKPVTRDRHTKEDALYLIESGIFTTEGWIETSASVDRGDLPLEVVQAGLLAVFGTLSIWDVAHLLDNYYEDIVGYVASGDLYAIEVSGQLRFPVWQFVLAPRVRLVEDLDALIPILSKQKWPVVAAFMNTPQQALVVEVPVTPAEWLQNGGYIDDVIAIVRNSAAHSHGIWPGKGWS